MAVERRDNDRQVEELRAEADEIERKVDRLLMHSLRCHAEVLLIDGGAYEDKPGRVERASGRILEAQARDW